MFRRVFIDHPASVGETYFQHLRSAASFSKTMLTAAACCLVHAIVPALFKTTASETVRRLHDRMVIHRSRLGR